MPSFLENKSEGVVDIKQCIYLLAVKDDTL